MALTRAGRRPQIRERIREERLNFDECVRSAMERNAVDRIELDGSRRLHHAGVGRPRNLWRRPDRIRGFVRNRVNSWRSAVINPPLPRPVSRSACLNQDWID